MENHAAPMAMEMAMEGAAKRKIRDDPDAPGDTEDAHVSADGAGESALAAVESPPRKKPRETAETAPPLVAVQPLDAHAPHEDASQHAQQHGDEHARDEDAEEEADDPAWILMCALERELADNAHGNAAFPVAPTAITIAEDDDYDESDGDD